MLESKEVGVDTSFFSPIRLCGFGGTTGETKVRRRRKEKRISWKLKRNALRCIPPKKSGFYPAPKTHVSIPP